MASYKKYLLRCRECGAKTEAVCECGVEYIPARVYVKEAIAQNPELLGLTNVALADQLGVGYSTVERALRDMYANTTSAPHGVDVVQPHLRRKGRDGKLYLPSQSSQRGRIQKLNAEIGDPNVTFTVRKAEPIGLMPNDMRERVEASIDEIRRHLEILYRLFLYTNQMSPELRHLFADEMNTIRVRAERCARQLVDDLRKINRPLCHIEIPLRAN